MTRQRCRPTRAESLTCRQVGVQDTMGKPQQPRVVHGALLCRSGELPVEAEVPGREGAGRTLDLPCARNTRFARLEERRVYRACNAAAALSTRPRRR
jgi:hypothetical protein